MLTSARWSSPPVGPSARMTNRILVFLLLLLTASRLPGQSPVRVDTGVAVPMRDSVTLRADLYRPPGNGRFPVLVYRTPYSRIEAPPDPLVPEAVRRGYAVLLQDVRGRYGSGGVFEPYQQEGR